MEASRAMAVLDEKFIVDDDLVIVELGANENWLAVGDSGVVTRCSCSTTSRVPGGNCFDE